MHHIGPHSSTIFSLVTVLYSCKVFKKFAGTWDDSCGSLDGEKLLCMDHLHKAILNGTCLVYSFGLADDWDFEIMMAELGKLQYRSK